MDIILSQIPLGGLMFWEVIKIICHSPLILIFSPLHTVLDSQMHTSTHAPAHSEAGYTPTSGAFKPLPL